MFRSEVLILMLTLFHDNELYVHTTYPIHTLFLIELRWDVASDDCMKRSGFGGNEQYPVGHCSPVSDRPRDILPSWPLLCNFVSRVTNHRIAVTFAFLPSPFHSVEHSTSTISYHVSLLRRASIRRRLIHVCRVLDPSDLYFFVSDWGEILRLASEARARNAAVSS